MPDIEITPEQAERLEALQADLAADVVGKYGHVRPRDAIEYLLDEYAADVGATDDGDGVGGESGTDDGDGGEGGETDDSRADETEDADAATDETGDADAEADRSDGDGETQETGDSDAETDRSGGDAMLNAMMSLLEEHDDKWGESSGEERYEVELPDGTTEQVRTKDDVRARLFKHYR